MRLDDDEPGKEPTADFAALSDWQLGAVLVAARRIRRGTGGAAERRAARRAEERATEELKRRIRREG